MSNARLEGDDVPASVDAVLLETLKEAADLLAIPFPEESLPYLTPAETSLVLAELVLELATRITSK
jgi:hypothetical protein